MPLHFISLLTEQKIKSEESSMNIIWLLVVAGGAAILGGAIAFGMFKQNPKRTIFALGGASMVALAAIGFGLIVSRVPETAPSNPPNPQGTQYDTPARPSNQNALPGTGQPNR